MQRKAQEPNVCHSFRINLLNDQRYDQGPQVEEGRTAILVQVGKKADKRKNQLVFWLI